MKFDITNVASMLCSMLDKKILVIGDIMLDRFIDGTVTRISPEAPVPILGQSQVRQMAGGAANVACNLAQLGLRTHLIGVYGNDTVAAELKTKIDDYPAIQFDPVQVEGRLTSLKTRYRANGQQILRVDDETTSDIDEKDSNLVLERVTAVLNEVDLVVISDYAKGALPVQLLRQIITAAKAKNKYIIVDPKRNDFSAYTGADLLTPNLTELQIATKKQLTSIDVIGKAAMSLAKTHGFGNILTTLGANGMILSQRDGTQFHDPASTRDIFDVSGAGDTALAMMTGAMATKVNLIDAVKLANHAAGIAVGKSGTAIVTPGELLARIGSTPPKIDWPNTYKKCNRWRHSGEKIAFANGCFDLLHPGHIHLLLEAAKTADRLVIGLNADASVRRLKGDGRPSQRVETRSMILAALPFVDAVAVFDEDTPFALIETLEPDVIIKGGDYSEQAVVGSDIVTARGGKVVIIPTLYGYSTTKSLTI